MQYIHKKDERNSFNTIFGLHLGQVEETCIKWQNLDKTGKTFKVTNKNVYIYIYIYWDNEDHLEGKRWDEWEYLQ